MIQGSGEEKYRPREVFGAQTTYAYQRLFGELHLEGFEVSHTKDGFRWAEGEATFLELLREHLDSDEMPLLRQARYYREKASGADLARMAKRAVESTADALQKHGPAAVRSAERAEPPPPEPSPALPPDPDLASRQVFDLDLGDGRRWRVVVELSATPSEHWVEIAQSVAAGAGSPGVETIGVRLSLEHPFMRQQVPRLDFGHVGPLTRIVAGLALAEKIAMDGGNHYPAAVRLNLNRLLFGPLARGGKSELDQGEE